MMPNLLGMPLEVVCEKLKSVGEEFEVTEYRGREELRFTPNEWRVVRANKNKNGIFELVVCEFKTKLDSQDN